MIPLRTWTSVETSISATEPSLKQPQLCGRSVWKNTTSPQPLELSGMQALTAPCSVHHGAHANTFRSASQTCPKRRKLPSASPVTDTTGDAKPGGLLLGCIQASSPVYETSADTNDAIHPQLHEQSLVRPHFYSLALLSGCSSTQVLDTRSSRSDATRGSSLVEPSAQRNFNTFVSTTSNEKESDVRELTRSTDSGSDIMTSMISMPGSPPELTESRSSKSSSYGSHLSVENDLSTEITNFEDIGLQDDTSSDNGRSDHGSPKQIKINSRKDTYHNRRSTLPDIKPHPQIRTTECVSRPAGLGSIRRGFTSPSTVPLAGQDSCTRSSSPPKRIPRSASSYSVSAVGSITGTSSRPSIPHSRRGSWQPQRKTIKEIEAEYHDSDDELPDDANLWNVPISPFHSADVSPRSSFRGSLDRQPSPTNVQPIPLEHVQSAPDFPRRNASSSNAVPRQRLTPRSSSTTILRGSPTSPTMPSFSQNGRAKSWNVAMSDLSAEARIVSQNLEHHADSSKADQNRLDKPALGVSHRSSAPGAIQLPPVQRGPLDFMPMSKEKEAVLSRTRPSWLPPKDPKEEQRHLKEYQKMMAASIEAEKKKESIFKNSQSQQDKTLDSLNRIWDFYVNPTTDITIIDRRVHDLCWRGIPARIRGQVWQRTIGNPLSLSTNTYHKALERANCVKTKPVQDRTHLERSIASWLSDIDRDAETAFPELGFFQRDGPLWQDLVNICEAYTCYRSDIGYHYGLQLIAALVLLQIPSPSEAFIFMANCLNKPTTQALHTGDVVATQRNYQRVKSNLSIKFPRLHDYLFEPMQAGGLGLTGQELFEPMFRTLFSNGLDFDRLCRIWDIWIFQGDRALIRIAVAVLGSLQSQIFEVNGDQYLKRRNIQEMLGWGPFNRTEKGGYWRLDSVGTLEAFVDEVNAAGKLDYTGH